MTDAESSPATSRRRHIVRLALFAAFLIGLWILVGVTRVVDVDDIRGVVAATGWAAPLTYVVVSALLGSLFVPGPILAAGSGVLFGPVLGTFVTLGATVGTATIASLAGRRAGRDSARALLGPQRADRIDAQIERRGLWAVVGQRFIPGVSDALASYAFGAFGVPLWQMALGAFIGSVPRAFVYTALGASIGDLSAPLAYTAIAVWCVTAVIGAYGAHRGYRTWRGHVRDRDAQPEENQPNPDVDYRRSMTALEFSDSIVVAVEPEALYDLVSDVTRTGEWSPVCKACWWDEGPDIGGPKLGAHFTGRNETSARTWETRSQVVAADRGHEFAWEVNGGFVRWGYTFEPADADTLLTESWTFTPMGQAGFRERYGDDADAQIAYRTEDAHQGIPETLAAIKKVAEGD